MATAILRRLSAYSLTKRNKIDHVRINQHFFLKSDYPLIKLLGVISNFAFEITLFILCVFHIFAPEISICNENINYGIIYM